MQLLIVGCQLRHHTTANVNAGLEHPDGGAFPILLKLSH